MWLFLAFLLVPIIEIALFIQVGGLIGLFPTLALVVLTAVAGTALVRSQGLQALARLQRSLAEGGDPVGPIANGAVILVSGVLLLTPGFFTDATGLALLMPPVRARLLRWLGTRILAKGMVHMQRREPPPRPGEPIEVDYEVVDESPSRPGNSGWTRPRD